MHGDLAFVGLSRIRDTSTFGGVPIAENRERLKCGVGVLDLRTGKLVGQLEFKTGVEEIFDLVVVAQTSQVAIQGPYVAQDGGTPAWVIPRPIASARK